MWRGMAEGLFPHLENGKDKSNRQYIMLLFAFVYTVQVQDADITGPIQGIRRAERYRRYLTRPVRERVFDNDACQSALSFILFCWVQIGGWRPEILYFKVTK